MIWGWPYDSGTTYRRVSPRAELPSAWQGLARTQGTAKNGIQVASGDCICCNFLHFPFYVVFFFCSSCILPHFSEIIFFSSFSYILLHSGFLGLDIFIHMFFLHLLLHFLTWLFASSLSSFPDFPLGFSFIPWFKGYNHTRVIPCKGLWVIVVIGYEHVLTQLNNPKNSN